MSERRLPPEGDGRCEASLTSSIHGGWRCSYRAKVQINGSWLCGVHAKKMPIPSYHLAVPPLTNDTERLPNGRTPFAPTDDRLCVCGHKASEHGADPGTSHACRVKGSNGLTGYDADGRPLWKGWHCDCKAFALTKER